MKKCELCDSAAKMYCESDQASLCWDCDIKVHGANFLVAKHSRTLLCHVCQSLTPWNACGPKLGPNTVSVCENCVSNKESRNEEDEERDDDEDGGEKEEEENSIGEDNDDHDGGENGANDDDGGNADDDEGNQVVPWSSSSSTPPDSSSLSDEECCHESLSRSRSSYPCKRRRYNAHQVRDFFI
uniref:B-box zinc finger protein 21-like n=1 Tax=Fragaria vesca subsp. vesca TaxID=101020 RepID=UPI0005C9B4C4|nr:PREDICTED: B-box zinc finger protein 21-like [Fragaria vesca subsp. vesca]